VHLGRLREHSVEVEQADIHTLWKPEHHGSLGSLARSLQAAPAQSSPGLPGVPLSGRSTLRRLRQRIGQKLVEGAEDEVSEGEGFGGLAG
jgi:hypothetical protein